MQRVRVGVIGTGIMGERHLRVYSELPEAEVVGVYDVDPARAVDVAGRHGGAVFSTPADLLRHVDAVSIAAPTVAHAELALQALDRDVHVLLEKPMAHSLKAAERIAARADLAARERGIHLLVGHIERFNPLIAELNRMVDWETVVSMTFRRTSLFDKRCTDTDVIHDLMIHDLDLATWFFSDELRCIEVKGGTLHSQNIDHATAQFSVGLNCRLVVIASRVAHQKARRIDIDTPQGRIRANLLTNTISVRRDAPATPRVTEFGTRSHAASRPRRLTEQFSVTGEEPLKAELRHFLDCVTGHATPIVDAQVGLRAMHYAEIVEAFVIRNAQDQPSLRLVDEV